MGQCSAIHQFELPAQGYTMGDARGHQAFSLSSCAM